MGEAAGSTSFPLRYFMPSYRPGNLAAGRGAAAHASSEQARPPARTTVPRPHAIYHTLGTFRRPPRFAWSRQRRCQPWAAWADSRGSAAAAAITTAAASPKMAARSDAMAILSLGYM
jgi:hypothetical protein